MTTLAFRPLLERRFHGGESPVWDERRKLVFFVDMQGARVHAVSLDGATLHEWVPHEPPYSLGLCESGRLLVSLPRRLMLLDPDSGRFEPFAEVPEVPPHARLNDGKTGPDGAFWVGSMDLRPERARIGRLFRVTPGGIAQQPQVEAITSNGLAWSADGRTMIHTDSRGQWIDLWRFDPGTGRLSDQRRIARPGEATGRPDGGACDREDTYWSAGISAGRLNRWSFAGALVESHPTPAPSPTMPCFCGEGLRTLVVTSLTMDHDRDHPATGMLMVAAAPVAGAPVGRIAGL